jgi:hypothetical protein
VDEKLLESLLREFLFDPKGADWVQVMVETLPGDSTAKSEPREGWLVRDKAGDKVFFTDGENIPAPPKTKINRVDFVAKCRKLYGSDPNAPLQPTGRSDESRPSGEWGEEPTLVLAAWLHRLGERELAAQVLAHAPPDREADVTLVRKWLAHTALNRMMECYANYQDQAALAHGERLFRLYHAEALELKYARPLFDDLRRRKRQGTLGKKEPAEVPDGFSRWEEKKQIEFLTGSLDQIQEIIPERIQHTTTPLPPRIAKLIALGDRAIPALLEALENDNRMTRAVRPPDEWPSVAEVQTVRDVAVCLVRRLLRVRHLDPRDLDADDDLGSPRDIKKVAAAARAYWKEFGSLSFEERMMSVLTRSGFSLPALREATRNLAGEFEPGESTWPHLVKDRHANPTILRFTNPTAAQAVLAAMDRDFANDDTLPRDRRMQNRANHEPLYFSALIMLGDRRIASELARRAESESNPLMRLQFAHASYRLGKPQAMRMFANDFAVGKVALSLDPAGTLSSRQLERIMEYMSIVRLSETNQALSNLAGPSHRYHAATVTGLVEREVSHGNWGSYLAHPSCVAIIRELLEDKTVTKMCVSIREEQHQLRRDGDGYVEWGPIPAILSDPKKRKAETALRRCDLAGEMCSLVAGLPAFHPLLNDADDRLAAMRKLLAQFRGNYRTLTPAEKQILADKSNDIRFVPDIPPLKRPATVADVTTGKAIFHLDSKGKVTGMNLAARGTFKAGAKETASPRCLIVQAEMTPDGCIFYGVIERHAIRMVSASDLSEVTPLKNIESE